MLVSAVTGQQVADTTSDKNSEIIVETTEIAVAEEKTEPTQKNTKQIVEDYFKDVPVMIDVAYCESRFRQFDTTGQVLRGKVNSADVGVMQINEKYHSETAKKLGHNIYTLEGNLDYAKYLYDTQGTRPWVHSSKCWNEIREVAFAN